MEVLPMLDMKFTCFTFCLKDFAMRSLKIVEDSNTEGDAIKLYQLKKEREWDKRYYNN